MRQWWRETYGQQELKEYCIRLDHDSLWRATIESQTSHDDAGIQWLLRPSRQVQKFLQISLSVRMVEYTLKTIFSCIIYQVSSSLFLSFFLYLFIHASFVVYNVYVGVPSVVWLFNAGLLVRRNHKHKHKKATGKPGRRKHKQEKDIVPFSCACAYAYVVASPV